MLHGGAQRQVDGSLFEHHLSATIRTRVSMPGPQASGRNTLVIFSGHHQGSSAKKPLRNLISVRFAPPPIYFLGSLRVGSRPLARAFAMALLIGFPPRFFVSAEPVSIGCTVMQIVRPNKFRVFPPVLTRPCLSGFRVGRISLIRRGPLCVCVFFVSSFGPY